MLEQLPREAVDPRPSLEVFEARLDGTLGSLGCCEMWRLVVLRVAGGWSFVILAVPSNPGRSTIRLHLIYLYITTGLVALILNGTQLSFTFWTGES